MAGIDTLIRGAVGSLAKDKITSQLTPTQMELASFILNPQYYMAEKGINKIADILGYGSEYRNLSADAKSDKDYYKEIMRDSIGDVLPSSIGDIVRATPRISEADQAPAGEYIAWNPNTQSFETQQSNSPAVVFDQFAGDRFGGKYNQDSVFNTNSQNYVGPANPKDMDSSIYSSNLTDLLSMLDEYRTAEVPEIVTTGDKASFEAGDTFDADLGMNVPSNTGGGDLSYTEMLDILNSTPSISASRGLNVPGAESLAPVGSVYDANIGANVPTIESLAPAGATYDANLGVNVPASEGLAPDLFMFDAGSGMNVPEAAAPEGYMFDAGSGMNEYLGGGSKGNIEDYSYSQYRYGGQIHRGRR